MVLPNIETLFKGYGAYHHNPMFYFILFMLLINKVTS